MKTYTLQTLQNENFRVSHLTEEEYVLLVNLPYTRKAGYLDNVDEKLYAENITEELENLLDRLPLIEVVGTVSNDDDFLYAYIFDADVQFYRVYVDGLLLLIDTQGYQYGRYALILDANATDFSTVKTDEQVYEEVIAKKNREIEELKALNESLTKKVIALKGFINANF